MTLATLRFQSRIFLVNIPEYLPDLLAFRCYDLIRLIHIALPQAELQSLLCLAGSIHLAAYRICVNIWITVYKVVGVRIGSCLDLREYRLWWDYRR